jgi:hypothetical protein
MEILTKRFADISYVKVDGVPITARITLTDELKEIGIDFEKDDKVVVILTKDKEIVIRKVDYDNP